MSTYIALIRRIVWPKKPVLSATIAGGASLIGDFANFVSDTVTPGLMMAVFSLIAIITAMFCLNKIHKIDPSNEDEINNTVDCAYCDAFRFGIISTAAFFVIMLLGQGQSVTEQIAGKLGLIEQKVATIATDVGEIKAGVGDVKSQVGDIHENTEAFRISENPTTAAEHFKNAWVYTHMRRDPARGWESIQAVYRDSGPRKLDGAELYFTLGRQFIKRSDLLARMRDMGRQYKDGTLLVVAARNSDSDEESNMLYAEAQSVDPDLPFAYWDPQSTLRGRSHDLEGFRQEKNHMQLFLEKAGELPISQYFFQPQPTDFEGMARMHAKSLERSITSFENTERFTKEQQEKFERAMATMREATTARSQAMPKEMAPGP